MIKGKRNTGRKRATIQDVFILRICSFFLPETTSKSEKAADFLGLPPLLDLPVRTKGYAGSFYLVFVVLLTDKRDGLEGIAQVISYLPGCCAVIMEGHLIFLVNVQHQVNLT